jgi:hypothetical protein
MARTKAKIKTNAKAKTKTSVRSKSKNKGGSKSGRSNHSSSSISSSAKKGRAQKVSAKRVSNSRKNQAAQSHSESLFSAGKRFLANQLAKVGAKDNSNDIVDLILQDHTELKRLIRTLKDTSADLERMQAAYDEFAPQLIIHAKPEEQSLYVVLKDLESLRTEGFEGEVEHTLADQLLEEIKRTEDEEEWCAKVKVLAELVEHHIHEEENHMLPNFRKESSESERADIGDRFLRFKEMLIAQGGQDSPPEREIRKRGEEADPMDELDAASDEATSTDHRGMRMRSK